MGDWEGGWLTTRQLPEIDKSALTAVIYRPFILADIHSHRLLTRLRLQMDVCFESRGLFFFFDSRKCFFFLYRVCKTTGWAVSPPPTVGHLMVEGQTRTLQASEQLDHVEVEQRNVPSAITAPPPLPPNPPQLKFTKFMSAKSMLLKRSKYRGGVLLCTAPMSNWWRIFSLNTLPLHCKNTRFNKSFGLICSPEILFFFRQVGRKSAN